MSTTDVALVAGFVIAFGVFSRKVEHSLITGPMVFVGFGHAIGSTGLDVLDLDLASSGVELVFVVMSWTVLLSIVVHGIPAGPGAHAYGRWWAGRQDDPMKEFLVENQATTPTRRRGKRR